MVLEDVSCCWLTSLVWFLPVLLFFLWNAVFKKKQECSDDAKEFTACKNPNCVRCQKYQTIRAKAKETLVKITTEENKADLGRIQEGIDEVNIVKSELQDPNVFYLPGIKAKPWWNEETDQHEDLQADIALLEKSFPDVLHELENIIFSEDGWTFNSTDGGKWSTFYLYNQGSQNVENCLKCPKMMDVLSQLKTFMKGTIFGNALISVMQPGTLITEHYGPTNIRIRSHLALKVPQSCKLSVANVSNEWQVGKCLVFDDSFLHQAEHCGTEGVRVILLVDLWHPEISHSEKNALSAIFSSQE